MAQSRDLVLLPVPALPLGVRMLPSPWGISQLLVASSAEHVSVTRPLQGLSWCSVAVSAPTCCWSCDGALDAGGSSGHAAEGRI